MDKRSHKSKVLSTTNDYALILFLEKKKDKWICTLKVFNFCILTFKLTFNNAFLIVSSSKGMPLIFFSAGLVGLKNSNKTTPLAARTLSLHMFDVIQKMEGLLLHVQLLGYGGRLRVFFTELRTLLRQNPQLQLVWLSSLTKLPLNGCLRERRTL